MGRNGTGYVRVNSAALDAELTRRSLTEASLIAGGVGRASLRRIRSDERIQRKTYRSLLKALKLDAREAEHLLKSSGARTVRQSTAGSWMAEGRPTAWLTTANQLQYRVQRMTHTVLPELFGRGKCYDLSQFSDDVRQQMTEALIRHPYVCRQLETHQAFPRNEHADFSDENHFWVIDREEEGATLRSRVEDGAVPPEELCSVMLQLVDALVALHDAGIIRRALTPEHVVLRPDGRILLVDLELAKLLSDRPSVTKGDLKPSTWLAPELNRDIDSSVDIYSWGKIFLYAATGIKPAEFVDSNRLTLPMVPKRVLGIVRAAVSASHRFRPDAYKVLKVMKGWKP
ncbi:MAG: protein kinase [Planctomycetaceae bacterium]